jgi:hypothetical protein
VVGERETRLIAGEDLLRRAVCVCGIKLGRPIDLVLDLGQGRALALEVLCGDEQRRLLPLAAATIEADTIEVGSALMLIDEQNGAFYRKRGQTLHNLRGAGVEVEGIERGTLADVRLGPDGVVVELLVEAAGVVVTVAPGPRIFLGGRALNGC